MNILISVNSNYYDAAIILLRSLFCNNRESDISIYLFHSELSKKQINRLDNLVRKNSGKLYVREIDDEVMKGVPIQSLSKETYYRLMAPSLLPHDLDRILYLDIDMIVTGNIEELYEADFDGNLFMAVPDTSTGIEVYKKKLQMHKKDVYINAGVLLLNLELLRQEFGLEEALNYARRYPDRVPNCDQDVINGLYHKRIGIVDWTYNYEARFHSVKEVFDYFFRHNALLQEIKIIHYMGSGKPWKANFCGKYLREYYKYARHTSFQSEIERNMRNRFFNISIFVWKEMTAGICSYLERFQ